MLWNRFWLKVGRKERLSLSHPDPLTGALTFHIADSPFDPQNPGSNPQPLHNHSVTRLTGRMTGSNSESALVRPSLDIPFRALVLTPIVESNVASLQEPIGRVSHLFFQQMVFHNH